MKALTSIPGVPPLIACFALLVAWEGLARLVGLESLPTAWESLQRVARDPSRSALAL